MNYSSNIVESLKEKGIYTTVSTNSQRNNDSPNNTLDYTTNNFYCSKNTGQIHWIKFDFKTIVALKSFEMYVGSSINLNCWNLSVSSDEINWRYVSSYDEVPDNKIYNLTKVENIRFAKIEGTSTDTPVTYIKIYYVKFYGSLTVKRTINACTCRRRIRESTNFTIILLLYAKSN